MHSRKTVPIPDLMSAANMELIRLDFKSSTLSRHSKEFRSFSNYCRENEIIALLLHQYASSCGCQSRFPAACSPMLMSSTALGGWIRASSYRHFHWTSRLIWPSSTPSTVSPSSMGLSFARMYDATL